jgi:iron complex outermembrane receptor protein
MKDGFLGKPVCLVLAGLTMVLVNAGPCEAAEITGRVLDARSGRPVAGALVLLQPGDREVQCDAGGGFSLASVEPGEYSLLIRYEGYREKMERLVVEPKGGRLEILLEPSIVEGVIVLAAPDESIASSWLLEGDVESSPAPGLGRLLREVPGVSAVRRGAMGLDPVVRGLREDQVATFVGGGRTFPACPGRMESGVGHIDPQAVSRVEVIKGPFALSRGAGALSAINVEMRRAGRFDDPSLTGGFRLVGQTHAEARSGYLYLEGGNQRSGYMASLASRSGNDYEAGGGAEVPADYESDDVRFLGDWDLRENSTLSLDLGYLDQGRIDYPGRPMNARSLDARTHGVGFQSLVGGETFLGYRLSAHSNRVDHSMDNQAKPNDQMIRSESDTEVNTASVNLSFDWSHPDSWFLTAGLDAYRLTQDGDRVIHRASDGQLLFDDRIWSDAQIRHVGAFVQQSLFGGRQQELTWGIRVDAVSARSDPPSQYFMDNTEGDLRQRELNLGTAVHWETRLSEGWGLTAGLGRAVRTPSALERYSNRFPSTRFQVSAEFLGSPEIRPETAHEIDVGVAWTGLHIDWKFDAYYREIEDYITVVPDPSLTKHLPASLDTVYRYINGDLARFLGAETIGLFHMGSAWTARVQVEWVRAEDEGLNEPLFGIPPLSGTASLRYTRPTGAFFVEGGVMAVDRQDRFALSRYELPTPGYTLYGLRIGVRLSERGSLEIVGENLTDEFYVDHLNGIDPFTGLRVPEPGRTVALAVLWGF